MHTSHNVLLVLLSYIVSALGSFTALHIATGIPSAYGRSFWLLLCGAAFALGGSIWAMHFIAMLAFQMPVDVSYDISLTSISLCISIVFVGIGFFIVRRSGDSLIMLLLAGLITGLGVASMHYIGMAAMRMPGKIRYDHALVGASVVISVAAATVALWLAFNLRGNWQRVGSALVMAAAVCGMHYTGMAAVKMTFQNDGVLFNPGTTLSPENLAVAVFAITVIFLLALLLGTMRQSRARQSYAYKDIY